MSEIDNDNTNIEQQKKDTKKKKKEDDSIKFSDAEMNVFDQVEKDLNLDLTHESDLEDPNAFPEVPNYTSEQLQDQLNDPKNRALLREETANPTIYDTLKDNDVITKMSKEELVKLRRDLSEEKQNLIVMLGSKPTISLHLKTGMIDGKNVWVEKPFPFNSLSKKDEFEVNVLRARLNTISIKYNIVGAKAPLTLDEDEINFLTKSGIMIEVAGWRYAEKEALKKFGMSPEDYARVDGDQYKIALLAWAWRSQNVPYYKQGR